MSAPALAGRASASSVAPSAVRVPADLVGGTLVREAALVVAGTVILTVAGWVTIPLPFTPVPVSLATLAVLLEGSLFGARRAGASTLLYLVLGLVGVPMFAGGATGWAFSSFGYVLGYLIAGIVVGQLAVRGAGRSPLRMSGVALLGSALVYVAGLAWLVPWLGVSLSDGVGMGVAPFLIGDVIKILVVAGVVPFAWRLVGSAVSGEDVTQSYGRGLSGCEKNDV